MENIKSSYLPCWSVGRIAVALALGFTSQFASADVLIHAGRVLNVRNGKYLENQGLLIVDDKIVRIETWDAFKKEIAAKVSIVDLTGKTVLPGLVDVHTHLLMSPKPNVEYTEELVSKSIPYRALEGAARAKQTLEAGFTTVRDVESEGAGFADAALRDAIENGLLPGPRMQVATRGIVALGYYYPRGVAPEYQKYLQGAQNVSGPEEARKAVREQIQGGADLIKMYADFNDRADSHPTLSPEEMKMIVDEAHRSHRKVAAHAVTPEGIKNAVEAGADSIEHGWGVDSANLKLMAAKKVTLVPTSSFLVLSEPPKDPKKLERLNSRVANLKGAMKRARELGVKVACGSDAADTDAHGQNGNEIIAMSKLGLTPLEALQAATLNGATLMGLQDKIGVVEAGKLADVIAVTGDPLKDLGLIKKVVFVMKAGKIYKND